ncbi:MAG: transcription antitermination factor NusB [Candidatus Margulisbacteria bacterium]|nr:transcription antitermination factor NusB [Candidatus Margulisiibacteriota bacterium]
MGKRSTARKLAMQALYQYQVQKANQEEILDYTLTKDQYIEETRSFAAEIFNGCIDNMNMLDKLIADYAIDWKLDRIALIDKAILRVAIWEMLFTDTSIKVIISEAIELIRKYSVYEAIKFINGVLGGIAKNRADIQKRERITPLCLPE